MATRLAGNPSQSSAGLRAGSAAILQRLRQCLARRRERIDLRELDDHLLRDLGLTRDQAEREARRRAWHGFHRR